MAKLKTLSLLALCLLSIPTTIISQQTEANTYDYIVIGSGPGGGPLAANLAKNGSSVLLLEAGIDLGTSLSQRVPSFQGQAASDPAQRWNFFVKYHSDPVVAKRYKHLTWRTKEGGFYVGPAGGESEGAVELGVYYPRAGTVGGCSTHNAMGAVLPADSDWENVRELTGDDSWSAANMRKYFEKLEHNDYLPRGTPGHGFDGFLDIKVTDPAQLQSQPELVTVLEATAKALGQDPSKLAELITGDLNNNSPTRDQQVGLSGFPTHINAAGVRVSARDAVFAVLNASKADGSPLYPLTLSTNSFATKILFDTSGRQPKATSVSYLVGQSMYAADPRYNGSSGTPTQAFARKEIIVSGGAFNTPQLLKLSGIGPSAELKKFNIPVLVDLPGVGANLQDNYEILISATSPQNFTSPSATCTYGLLPDPCLSLRLNGTGPYTLGLLDSLMYKTTSAAFGERDLFMWASPGAFKGFWPQDSVNVLPADPPSTFSFNMAKMHPRSSSGSVLLSSADPRAVPAINFRFFEDAGGDADIEAMLEGLSLGRSIFSSLQNSSVGPFVEKWPCDSLGGEECDEKRFVKEQSWSHHASSSCAIGGDGDGMAVLDGKFRVRGTQGLRVVDASVFPRSPGGFPVLPTFVVGEKAFEDIVTGR